MLTNYGARRGIIDIEIVEARDLKSCKMLRSMDPYCKVTINGVTKESGVHENGHKNPTWNERLQSMMVGNVDANEITVELWDKDSFSSDDLIASGTIRAADVANACEDNELSGVLTIALEPRGELRIRGKFTLDEANANAEARDAEAHNYGRRRGIIDLHVVEGRDLKNCNWVRSMDPYVRVTINGVAMESGVHDNGHKNPTWNEQLGSMMVGNIDGDAIAVELYDKDTLSEDDLIATGAIQASAVANAAAGKADLTSDELTIELEPKGTLRLKGRFVLDTATAKEGVEEGLAAITATATAPAPVAAPAACAFAVDVDGDGRADYIVPAGTHAPKQPIAIDVNGDGVADYVVAAP